MTEDPPERPPLYQRIYDMVRQIPPGKVATYGQIARLVGGCTPRMVGYAMSALTEGTDVPWQRVINYKGKISPHGLGYGSALQRQILEEEGVLFDPEGKTDFELFGWLGQPDIFSPPNKGNQHDVASTRGFPG